MTTWQTVTHRVLEPIQEDECRELLTAHHVGRLAVAINGSPKVFPVNYAFDGNRIAIRTDLGSKLTATRLQRVAFEIDSIDEQSGTGWSVHVDGVGFEITHALDNESLALRALDVDAWAPGPKTRWIRIDIDAMTGRRLRLG